MTADGLAAALVCLLIAVNAGFVAAEFAIVTIRHSRIEAMVRAGSRRATLLQRVVRDLDAHVSAIQLAITSIGVAIGWLGEPAIARLMTSLLATVGVTNVALIHTLAVTIAFLLITSSLVVVGELAPKFLGLRRTDQVALFTAPLVYGFARMTRPVLVAMNRAAELILRAVGVKRTETGPNSMDPEELRIFLSELTTLGRLSIGRREMLEKVFDFAEHTASQVMIPRDQIDFLSLERPLEENIAIVMETGHTRYPLCERGLDGTVGMVHIKDMFQRSGTLTISEDLRLIEHDMLFVPESQAIDELQKLFQRRRAHMAVVVDEYGVPTGLVTMEDVLEELVGEIRDEFDKDEPAKIIHSDDGMIIDGMLLIDDLCRELGVSIENGHADTVGGYVTSSLGKIARVGDRFDLADYNGRVVEMQGRRVARVRLEPSRTPNTGTG
ncbi:MAG: hemolysin family protein [Candidatus Binatia bacterium]